jgi:hypothetical protein
MRLLFDPPLDEGRPHTGLSWGTDAGKSTAITPEWWADFTRWLTSAGGPQRFVFPPQRSGD